MKRVFVEPSMKRIELNLSENIADSTSAVQGYDFKVAMFGCTIVETEKYVGQVSPEEAETCRSKSKAKIGGRVSVPEEQVRMFIRY